MPGDLAEKTAVVTGGASGNGRAIALTFAEEGADVVVADLQREPRQGGTPTDEKISESTDSDATYAECDVTDVGDLTAAVEAAESFGGIDIMVNNAGMLRTETFVDVSEAAFQQMMDVNIKGVFFGAQAAAEAFLDGDGGCIINMSSAGGLQGSPELVSYCASKGAVTLMTYSLAAELGPENVRVNALHPGIIKTAMTVDDSDGVVGTQEENSLLDGIPLRRIGTPEDVADAALFLASEQSGYINGESLVVDGGMYNTA
jgi:NAD(P)-dependent dehydrogenase (short-subunit alcohol dehydrogenase family)